jgi:hypothetical protein
MGGINSYIKVYCRKYEVDGNWNIISEKKNTKHEMRIE